MSHRSNSLPDYKDQVHDRSHSRTVIATVHSNDAPPSSDDGAPALLQSAAAGADADASNTHRKAAMFGLDGESGTSATTSTTTTTAHNGDISRASTLDEEDVPAAVGPKQPAWSRRQLPDYKDQVRDGVERSIIAHVHENIPSSNSSSSNNNEHAVPQWNVATAAGGTAVLPDYKDQVRSRTLIAQVNDITSDSVAASGNVPTEHNHQHFIPQTAPSSNGSGSDALPDYKDQVRSRTLIAHVNDIASNAASESVVTSGSNYNEPRGLPHYKDQVNYGTTASTNSIVAHVNDNAATTTTTHAQTSVHYAPIPPPLAPPPRTNATKDFASPDATVSAQNVMPPVSAPPLTAARAGGGGMPPLPNFKDQMNDPVVLVGRQQQDDDDDDDMPPNQGLTSHNNPYRAGTAAAAAVTAWPNYKDQMRPAAAGSDSNDDGTVMVQGAADDSNGATATAALETLPTYKNQVNFATTSNGSESILATSGTSAAATASATAATAASLPSYKDQLQDRSSGADSRNQAAAALDTPSPASVESPRPKPTGSLDSGPDYKDQVVDRGPRVSGFPPPNRADPAARAGNQGARTGGLPKNQADGPDMDENRNSDQRPEVDHMRMPETSPQIEPPPQPTTEFNLSSPTVAVAEPHIPAVVVYVDGAVAFADNNNANGAIVEGVGVLVDEIFEEEPESATLETGNETTETSKEFKEVPWFQKWRAALVLAALVVIGAVAVGGVCGSGACGGGGGGGGNDTAVLPTPTFPTATSPAPSLAPTISYVRGTAPYFETTGELYWAVDQYVKAVYYGNGTGDTFLVNDLIEQYGNVSEWDVSRLTDFSLVFYRGDRSAYTSSASDLTNFVPEQTMFVDDISGWNVSMATTMEGMFAGAMNFSQNLSAWDTSRVSTMRAMFHSASSFNGDVGGWNVGSVTDFSAMFFGCFSFEGIELSAWDTSAAADMSNMFAETGSLAGNLAKWNVGRLTTLEAMFRSSNFNGDLTSWNTSRVGSLSTMVRPLTRK
jgi:surface protein